MAFVSPLPDDDDNWAVGRVKITTGAGIVKYLDIVEPGEPYSGNPPAYFPGEEGVWIGGGGEFFGASWVQGVLPDDVDSIVTFAIELGLNHYDSSTGSISFQLLAATNEHAYDDLQQFMYPLGDLNPMTAVPWEPA